MTAPTDKFIFMTFKKKNLIKLLFLLNINIVIDLETSRNQSGLALVLD